MNTLDQLFLDLSKVVTVKTPREKCLEFLLFEAHRLAQQQVSCGDSLRKEIWSAFCQKVLDQNSLLNLPLTLSENENSSQDLLEKRVIRILSSPSFSSGNSLELSSSLEDLGFDELSRVEFAIEYENLYEIEIPDESMRSWVLVKDIVETLKRVHSLANIPISD